MSTQTASGKLLDTAGISVSALCAMHCAASALFTTTLSLAGLGSALSLPWLEWAFFGTSVTLGAIAFASGYRVHRCVTPSPLFVGGIVALLIARLLPDRLEWMEIPLVVTGAGTIISAHWLNWRRRSCCHADLLRSP